VLLHSVARIFSAIASIGETRIVSALEEIGITASAASAFSIAALRCACFCSRVRSKVEVKKGIVAGVWRDGREKCGI
jgi:hypothetical protein